MDFRCLIALSVLFLLPDGVSPFKILILVADFGSHVLYHGRLAVDLASRGHQVTFVTGSKIKIPTFLKKTRGITFDNFYYPGVPFSKSREYTDPILKAILSNSNRDYMDMVSKVYQLHNRYSLQMLNESKLMDRLEDANFDFAVVDVVILVTLVIPYRLGVPYATLGFHCAAYHRRIPHMPSYIPHMFSTFSDKMTFSQRVQNFLLYLLDVPVTLSLNHDGHHIIKIYAPNKPIVPFCSLISKADLCIGLTDSVLDFTKPTMPDMVSIVTLITQKAMPLEGEFASIISQTSHGVILVSFGTFLDDLPESIIRKLLNVFATFPHTFIFKLGKQISLKLPANVYMVKWMPQNDILGHTNTKLFITHGGINGLIESVYHAVPLIIFPLFADQSYNAALVESKGLGETLIMAEFTEQDLTDKMQNILSQQTYTKKVTQLSAIFRNSMQSGKNNTSYWIEHVIQYGSQHLKSTVALEMPWYQYLMVDVILFLVVIMILLKILVIGVIYCCYKTFCKKKKIKIQ